MLKFLAISGIQAALLALFASMAFGAPDGANGARREPLNEPHVQVTGKLICNLGTENNGQPCSLQLMEDGTGRMFRLYDSSPVMRLYFDGTRRANVEGRPSPDATAIYVQGVTGL